ncbi:hypothetical protein Droror1_Dr00015587 [Drosera rotundifolia]
MSVTNNSQPKNIVGSSPFGTAGTVNPNMPPNFSSPPPNQGQPQIGVGNQNQFQLAQAQAIAQAQAKAAQHAQLQAHLQSQGITLSQHQNAGTGNLGTSSPLMSGCGNLSAKRIP